MKKSAVLTVWLLLALLVSVPLLTIGGHIRRENEQKLAQRKYAVAFNSLLHGYAEKMEQINKRGWPSRSAPSKVKNAFFATRITDEAKVEESMAQQLATLTPPPGREKVHSTMIAFYHASAQGNLQWAAATRSGDQKAESRTSEQLHEIFTQYYNAFKKMGLTFPADTQFLFASGSGKK